MGEANISQEIKKYRRSKKNYFIKEIDQNELTSKEHKTLCTILNYTKHYL